MREAFENDLQFKSVQELFEASRGGNIKAQYIIEEGVKTLALSVANLINITGVNKVIIGGKIAYSYDLIEKQMMMNLHSFVHLYDRRDIKVTRSELIDQASLVGAAEIARMN